MVNDEVAKKLRLIGDERDKFLAELVRKAYSQVFEVINIDTARAMKTPAYMFPITTPIMKPKKTKIIVTAIIRNIEFLLFAEMWS